MWEFFITMVVFFYSNHIGACLWALLGEVESLNSSSSWYTPDKDAMEPFSLYINCFYFMVTTMTTVGYGDMTVGTTNERAFCMCVMVIGVIIFGFVTGSIASTITMLADANAPLKLKMGYLDNIKGKFDLDVGVYTKVRSHIIENEGEDN
jgi:hypothetical protein